MRVVTVVGARPQFVKAAPLALALRRGGHDELLVHTGQHYDAAMSDVFFADLGLRPPDVNLEVGSGPHGRQTGEILSRIELVLDDVSPDAVVVFGDTNSTLAGALAAAKLRLPVVHVEAGLRSFNRDMPEETNRVLTDHCSDLLLCPTPTAVANLEREGVVDGVHLVGDVMHDAVLLFAAAAEAGSTILADLGLAPRSYLLLTVHRAENTRTPDTLIRVLPPILDRGLPVVFPVHPRTRPLVEAAAAALGRPAGLRAVDPVGYLDMLRLEGSAAAVATDSGGVQKEAAWLGVPCVTLREETEWVETVAAGWNVVAGTDPERIAAALDREPPSAPPAAEAAAADRCVAVMEAEIPERRRGETA